MWKTLNWERDASNCGRVREWSDECVTLCVMRSLRMAGRLAAYVFFADITWNNQTTAANACLAFAVNFKS